MILCYLVVFYQQHKTGDIHMCVLVTEKDGKQIPVLAAWTGDDYSVGVGKKVQRLPRRMPICAKNEPKMAKMSSKPQPKGSRQGSKTLEKIYLLDPNTEMPVNRKGGRDHRGMSYRNLGRKPRSKDYFSGHFQPRHTRHDWSGDLIASA